MGEHFVNQLIVKGLIVLSACLSLSAQANLAATPDAQAPDAKGTDNLAHYLGGTTTTLECFELAISSHYPLYQAIDISYTDDGSLVPYYKCYGAYVEDAKPAPDSP